MCLTLFSYLDNLFFLKFMENEFIQSNEKCVRYVRKKLFRYLKEINAGDKSEGLRVGESCK